MVYFNIIMNEILKIGLTFILVIIVTSVLQWSALAIYNIWCSPTSVSGFINTAQYELSKKYISLWAGAAVAITSFIIAKLVIKN